VSPAATLVIVILMVIQAYLDWFGLACGLSALTTSY